MSLAIFYIFVIGNESHKKTKTNNVCFSVPSVFSILSFAFNSNPLGSYGRHKSLGHQCIAPFLKMQNNFPKQLLANITQRGGKYAFVGDYFQQWINTLLML